MKTSTDLVVIGTGVAGMTAARLARSAGLSTAMIESLFYGGLITNVNELVGPVHGSGTEYATKLMSEACDAGANNIDDGVVIDLSHISRTVATADRKIVSIGPGSTWQAAANTLNGTGITSAPNAAKKTF